VPEGRAYRVVQHAARWKALRRWIRPARPSFGAPTLALIQKLASDQRRWDHHVIF
jgi:hypothetical protein